MKRNPYFTKTNEHGQEGLWFHTGDGAELIFTYHQEHLAAAAEKIANDAYNRGELHQLRIQKHRLNVETQELRELLDALTY